MQQHGTVRFNLHIALLLKHIWEWIHIGDYACMKCSNVQMVTTIYVYQFNCQWYLIASIPLKICAPIQYSRISYAEQEENLILFSLFFWNGLHYLSIILMNTESIPLHWCHTKMFKIIPSVWLWITKVEIDFNFKHFKFVSWMTVNMKVKRTENHMRCKLLK